MRNGGKKQRKNREERVLYALKRGKKTESNRDEKRGKKGRKNREERVLYALKRGKKTGSPTEKRKGVKKVEKK